MLASPGFDSPGLLFMGISVEKKEMLIKPDSRLF